MAIFRRAALVFACVALAAPAFAARRPKNPKRAARAQAQTAPPPAASEPAIAPQDRLPTGGWSAPARRALERLISARGKSSPGYDARRPPVAVLPWSGCAIDGDASEAVYLRLVDRAEFKFDDALWKTIPLGFGRQRARAAHEQFAALAPEIWSAQPGYGQYRKAMVKAYLDIRDRLGVKEARVFLAAMLKGFRVEELESFAERALAEDASRPLAEQAYADDAADPAPAVLRRGWRPVPEIEALARLLRARGFDVWAISPDPQVVLEKAAAAYGIDPTRAFGVRQGSGRGQLDGRPKEPVPVRAGKVEVVTTQLGRPPDLALGCAREDRELLEYGSGLRLVLGTDPVLLRAAEASRWVVQPPFGPPQ